MYRSTPGRESRLGLQEKISLLKQETKKARRKTTCDSEKNDRSKEERERERRKGEL